MDEAMHPLALLCFGMYGEVLPNQDGAPLRLVLPWKYGFKSIKAIVRVHFTDSQPDNTWHRSAPNEYGFYSNVNPEVSHPRWSQATERRLPSLFKNYPTKIFNGYGDQDFIGKVRIGVQPQSERTLPRFSRRSVLRFMESDVPALCSHMTERSSIQSKNRRRNTASAEIALSRRRR